MVLDNHQIPWCHLTNKNIKMSSFKSSENIQKKEGGPDRSISDNQSILFSDPERTGNESQKIYCNFEFQQGSHTLTDINRNWVQITKTVQNISADRKGPKVKYNLHYGRQRLSMTYHDRPW